MKDVLMNENGDLTPAILFSKENARRLFGEHEPLYKKHVFEVGYFKQDKPEMMWGDYFRIEDAGVLRIFCVRAACSKLIGYAIYFVRQNLHYASTKIAQCDMIYIEPEYRGGTGERFVEWIDGHLKAEGVHAVTHHAKTYYDFGSMLKRQKYEHVENIYVRRLN
jgi:hypothetical protein